MSEVPAGHVDRGAHVGAEVDAGRPETNPVPATVTVLVPAGGPLFGVTDGDRRCGVVGVGVGQGGRRPTPGGGHGHRDRAGPRRDDDGEASAALVTSTEVPAVGPEVDGGGSRTNPVPSP